MAAVSDKSPVTRVLSQLFGAIACFVQVYGSSLAANGVAQLVAAGHGQVWRKVLVGRMNLAAGSNSFDQRANNIRRASSTCAVVTTALEPEVQEGDGSGATGSPHVADMHKAPGLVP